jgi:hypothetical protein
MIWGSEPLQSATSLSLKVGQGHWEIDFISGHMISVGSSWHFRCAPQPTSKDPEQRNLVASPRQRRSVNLTEEHWVKLTTTIHNTYQHVRNTYQCQNPAHQSTRSTPQALWGLLGGGGRWCLHQQCTTANHCNLAMSSDVGALCSLSTVGLCLWTWTKTFVSHFNFWGTKQEISSISVRTQFRLIPWSEIATVSCRI